MGVSVHSPEMKNDHIHVSKELVCTNLIQRRAKDIFALQNLERRLTINTLYDEESSHDRPYEAGRLPSHLRPFYQCHRESRTEDGGSCTPALAVSRLRYSAIFYNRISQGVCNKETKQTSLPEKHL